MFSLLKPKNSSKTKNHQQSTYSSYSDSHSRQHSSSRSPSRSASPSPPLSRADSPLRKNSKEGPFPPLPPPPTASHILLINFRRLLSRYAKRMNEWKDLQQRGQTKPLTEKEKTLNEKSLQCLKEQLEKLKETLDEDELQSYLRRLSHLSTLLEQQISSANKRSKVEFREEKEKEEYKTLEEPILIASSSLAFQNNSYSSDSRQNNIRHENDNDNPLSTKAETHTLINRKRQLFSTSPPSYHSSIKEELFRKENPERFLSSSSSSGSLSSDSAYTLDATQSRLTDELHALAPSLREAVTAIHTHLHTSDVAALDETNNLIEANVSSVKGANIRLREWSEEGWGESCALSSIIVFVVLIFMGMVILMKLVPAPRH